MGYHHYYSPVFLGQFDYKTRSRYLEIEYLVKYKIYYFLQKLIYCVYTISKYINMR